MRPRARVDRVPGRAPPQAVGAWLRSPDASGSYGFCIVYTSGAAGTNTASYSLGVAPGFRIGIKAKTAEPAQD